MKTIKYDYSKASSNAFAKCNVWHVRKKSLKLYELSLYSSFLLVLPLCSSFGSKLHEQSMCRYFIVSYQENLAQSEILCTLAF